MQGQHSTTAWRPIDVHENVVATFAGNALEMLQRAGHRTLDLRVRTEPAAWRRLQPAEQSGANLQTQTQYRVRSVANLLAAHSAANLMTAAALPSQSDFGYSAWLPPALYHGLRPQGHLGTRRDGVCTGGHVGDNGCSRTAPECTHGKNVQRPHTGCTSACSTSRHKGRRGPA